MAAALMTGISGIRRRLSVIPPFLDKGSSGNSTGQNSSNAVSVSPRYIPQSIEYFVNVTNFSKKEIKSLYRNFKNDCPNGIVNEETFKDIYGQFFPMGDAGSYAHFLFRAFDVDDAGELNFEQFVIGLSTLLRGTLQDRLKWTFRLYDVNNDGFITKEGMLQVVTSLYSMLGNSNRFFTEHHCEIHVDKVFEKFDAVEHGIITLEDFCAVCEKDESIITSFRIFDHAL